VYGNVVKLSRRQISALAQLVQQWEANDVTVTATSVEGAVSAQAGPKRPVVLLSRDGRTFDLKKADLGSDL
jgi:hypothetical protein